MLALSHVGRTLGVMQDIGLLSLPDNAISHLLRYEEIGGRAPEGRLALLRQSPKQLQSEWRFSNDLAKQVEQVLGAADLVAVGQIGEAAYRFGEAAVEGLAVAAVREEWSRDLLAEAARELGRTVVPPFPVSGHDLAGLGFKPGPALGKELSRLEREWIDSGFTLDHTQLLALARF